MEKLDTLILRVVDPQAQYRFYRDIVGMSDQGDGRLGFSSREMAIQFVKAETHYTPNPSGLYWKIALSVPNIELACRQLQKLGVSCTEPIQFRDVGYLAKFTDPEGFSVELIDHWFKGERPHTKQDENLLGGGATLNLLTLRTADISAVEMELLNWGMTPLSVQPVPSNGFTLYFYAFTDEKPPNIDLQAIENRTWVYRRPYTVLEIQHVHELAAEVQPPKETAGYGGMTISTSRPIRPSQRLLINEVPPKQSRQ